MMLMATILLSLADSGMMQLRVVLYWAEREMTPLVHGLRLPAAGIMTCQKTIVLYRAGMEIALLEYTLR